MKTASYPIKQTGNVFSITIQILINTKNRDQTEIAIIQLWIYKLISKVRNCS